MLSYLSGVSFPYNCWGVGAYIFQLMGLACWSTCPGGLGFRLDLPEIMKARDGYEKGTRFEFPSDHHDGPVDQQALPLVFIPHPAPQKNIPRKMQHTPRAHPFGNPP